MHSYRIGFGTVNQSISIVFEHESESTLEQTVLEQACEKLREQLENDELYRLSKWGKLKHANLYFNNLTPKAMYIENADTDYVRWERKDQG